MSKSTASAKTTTPAVKFVIEKGVAIPPRKTNKPSLYREAIAKMAVGDSVLVPGASQVISFRLAAKTAGFGVETRKDGDKVRVWLTAPKAPRAKKAKAAAAK